MTRHVQGGAQARPFPLDVRPEILLDGEHESGVRLRRQARREGSRDGGDERQVPEMSAKFRDMGGEVYVKNGRMALAGIEAARHSALSRRNSWSVLTVWLILAIIAKEWLL